MAKPINAMTASEYKEFLLNNKDEAEKLDQPQAPTIVPTGFWRNGQWVQFEGRVPENK